MDNTKQQFEFEKVPPALKQEIRQHVLDAGDTMASLASDIKFDRPTLAEAEKSIQDSIDILTKSLYLIQKAKEGL